MSIRAGSSAISEAADLFIQLNIWLAVNSIIMMAASATAVGLSPSTLGAGIVLPGLLVYFVYVRERLRLPAEDRINHPYRTQLVEKYFRPLRLSEYVSLGVFELVLLSQFHGNPLQWALLAFLAHLPIGILYVYSRLKQQRTIDSVAVALAWSVLIGASVVISGPVAVTSELLALMLGWFLIVFAGVESRNIGDVEGDRQTGNESLPARIGRQSTVVVEWTLKLSGLGVLLVLGGPVTLGLVLLYLLLLRIFRGLTERSRYYSL